MTATIADILAVGFIVLGVFFMLVGAVGIVRLPDTYHRLHAASKCSTLGLMGMLIGAMFHIQESYTVTKGIMVIIFAFAANPVGSHMLAKASLRARFGKWEGTIDDEHECTKHAKNVAREPRGEQVETG
ncbi:MAG: monovalent cation/H(+) antiporter subunit G, partial [Firmicutes bacterium]|nr:monovalent cation/H(+) antiporter subunit G [Bacillota bacterium]